MILISVDEFPVHDKPWVDQSGIDFQLGQGEKSGNFEVEMYEPVTGQRPGLLVRVPVLFAMGTIDLIDNLNGHIVVEGE